MPAGREKRALRLRGHRGGGDRTATKIKKRDRSSQVPQAEQYKSCHDLRPQHRCTTALSDTYASRGPPTAALESTRELGRASQAVSRGPTGGSRGAVDRRLRRLFAHAKSTKPGNRTRKQSVRRGAHCWVQKLKNVTQKPELARSPRSLGSPKHARLWHPPCTPEHLGRSDDLLPSLSSSSAATSSERRASGRSIHHQALSPPLPKRKIRKKRLRLPARLAAWSGRHPKMSASPLQSDTPRLHRLCL